MVKMYNTVFKSAVVRDRKLALPEAPNRLPELPLPKAAPMSAPLPCWIRIRPIMPRAVRIWTARTRVRITFIADISGGCVVGGSAGRRDDLQEIGRLPRRAA